MTNLLEFSLSELEKELGLAKFRAKQIYKWVHKKHARSFGEMTDLAKDLRAELSQKYEIFYTKIIKTSASKDKTKKYLLKLQDGNQIETVHMIEDNRATVCVSTQVGCKFSCRFCATGKMGLIRNLTVPEILSQIYLSDCVNNVVFMGMGEPFLNFENVLKSIHILNSKDGMGIGARKITISTAGVPSGIKNLAEVPLQVRLAVSLNSARNEVRSKIMPINKTYSLDEVRSALEYYQDKTGRRVTLEYVMLGGINDSDIDLHALIDFCHGLKVNVNLIPFNAHDKTFKPSPRETIEYFLDALKDKGIGSVRRISRGADINAACGQLAVYNG